MKYAVWITRGEHWCLESRDLAPISKGESLAYFEKDPEFQRVTKFYGYCPWPFKVMITEVPGYYYEWIAHPRYRPIDESEILRATDEASFRKAVGDPVIFCLQKSGISISTPDDEALAKVKQVARVLGANVIGDEEERY